ncbi:nephrocystin-4-like isoform X2 [Liolophura sinensis]|uniref:nephrocystin-4-like isoform X2 n=1 Tax=Liolophura sinensis TaxID=3198878 RepID=UPI0031596F1D
MALNMARTLSRNVTIRWAAWNPFLDFTSPDVNISLVGGPGVMPDDTLVYRVPPTDMQDKTLARVAPGAISFYWSDMRKGGELLGLPHGSAMSHHLPSFEDVAEHMMDVSHGKPPIPVNKGRAMLSPRAKTSGSQQELILPQAASMAYGQHGLTPRAMSHQHMMPAMSHHAMSYHHMGYPVAYQSVPYPVEIGHLHERPSNVVGAAGPDLHELPFTPVHAPIMLTGPTVTGHGLSRAAYARLYSVGFPPILDRNGDPPEVIDPQAHISVDLAKEEMDPLSCNEITFQFLAFSKMLSYQPSGPASQSGTVFFTFNFYRYPQLTTERLLLSKPQSEMTNDPSAMPFVLQRLDKDGSILKGSPGYQIRYLVDPGFLKPGERSLFLQHLSQQTLHIDVWDGDSLLLIGSASVELKCLLRRGYEAVQTTYELDVMLMEYEDDLTSNMTGDLHRGGSVRPVGVNTLVKGRLHLRMANVGHLPDMKAIKQVPLVDGCKTNVLVSETAGKSAYIGGSLTSGTGTGSKKSNVVRAQNLVENNREVASLVASQRGNLATTEKTNREGDAERQRKLSRMQVVRSRTKEEQEELENKPLNILGVKQEKAERMRDLKTIDFYRQQTKRDGILNMLSQNMTTEHTIYPSFGTTEFFEFVLRNPYNIQHTVVVECNDPELRVIMDTREWRHFKQVHQVNTPVEEGMFSKSAETSQLPEIFLRPKETVNIPFKFVMFSADQSVQPQGPLDPFNKERNERNTLKDKSSLGETGSALSRLIKVYFKSEDNKPLSVLKLKVEPQPHIIDQTFRFHHPEQAFLKKSIRLPPFHALPGAPVGGTDSQKLYVRCSDPNVICESKKTQAGEPQDVFLKVACGPSPQIKKFFIAIYTDHYFTRPSQLWQFYIHALQRVDVASVEGQTNQFSLILRGTQSSRLVRCYSSHPNEMILQPAEPFMLAASTVHELRVAVRPMRVGNKFFYINVVDTEYHQLLRTWLVCVNCRAPMISRAFELNLPIGGGKGSNKRITFTNPYPYKKTFLLRSNRDDLLQFKDTRLEIDGGATQNIGLRFAPCMRPGVTEILIFINDEEEKNEETFCIKASYSLE